MVKNENACLGVFNLNKSNIPNILNFHFSSVICVNINKTWALIQYEDVILPVQEIPLWIKDGYKIVLSPQWDFLYW